VLSYFCGGLSGAGNLGYFLSLAATFKSRSKKKEKRKAMAVRISGIFIADFNNFMS
jgi:thiamine transporter ThiT